MSAKFEALAKLGAGEFEHLDGTLIEHLKGTKQWLEKWGASTDLQDAGLYHAVYGTEGFDKSLVSTTQRDRISTIIGAAAEEIVYQYCACDREKFFSKIVHGSGLEFENRFNGESYLLPEIMLRNFCELTAANEIEIAIGNPDFVIQNGAELNCLFIKMAPYLSDVAKRKAAEVFGACDV